MRKVLPALIAIVLIASAGCKKKDNTQLPSVRISTPSGGTLGQGPYGQYNIIKVKVSGEKGDNRMRQVEVYFGQNLSKGQAFNDPPVYSSILQNGDKDSFADTVSLNTGANYGNYVYHFVVTDDNGYEASQDFTLNIQ
jgi:hypothetical protein